MSKPKRDPLAEVYRSLAIAGRWLIRYQGVELEVLGGPYHTQREFGQAVVDAVGACDFDDDTTLHIMDFGPEGPETGEFSGKFIEAAQRISAEESEPGDWTLVMEEQDSE